MSACLEASKYNYRIQNFAEKQNLRRSKYGHQSVRDHSSTWLVVNCLMFPITMHRVLIVLCLWLTSSTTIHIQHIHKNHNYPNVKIQKKKKKKKKKKKRKETSRILHHPQTSKESCKLICGVKSKTGKHVLHLAFLLWKSSDCINTMVA